MHFFYLFSSFYVSYVLSISSSSSFDRQCKLEGGKRFLSMSTCRTLTLGGHSECSKGNPKIHRKKKKKENWAKQAREKEKLSFDFFGPGSLVTIRLFDEYFTY